MRFFTLTDFNVSLMTQLLKLSSNIVSILLKIKNYCFGADAIHSLQVVQYFMFNLCFGVFSVQLSF